MGMRAQIVIPVLASILILGTLGIQNAFADHSYIVVIEIESPRGEDTIYVINDVCFPGDCTKELDVDPAHIGILTACLGRTFEVTTGDDRDSDICEVGKWTVESIKFENFAFGQTVIIKWV